MKSRTPLVLMELLVMVLVFALAAALCLRCFVLSHRLGREDRDLSQAATAIQNAAEALKACGDPAEAVRLLQGSGTALYYDAKWNPTNDASRALYRLDLLPLPGMVSGLGQAEVRAVKTADTETPLYTLTVAWQEVAYD